AGETLWSIAERYYTSGYNWADIAKANGLADANRIVVGQKLTIPNVEVKQAVVSTVEVTPVVTQSAISGETYAVIKGDSLWSISVRSYGDGYRWKGIATANKLVNPRLIHAGNVLLIPRP
ncbi:MAG: LysM peptidoglycan-binding domain-containing protein, partial [Patescibacteria group bacterium]